MDAGLLPQLVDHLRWADARVLAGLRAAPGSDPRALELYAHVLGAEQVWVSRALGRPSPVAVWPSLTLDECEALAMRNATELLNLVSNADPAALRREVLYVNSAGHSFRSTVQDIALHVAMHGSYHRGQVALLVRAAGGEPSPTDFIAFTRGAPTAIRKGGKPSAGTSS